MKRLILAAGVTLAVAIPATAQADPPICHDGILSDDAGQGCTNDAAYGVASSSGWADGAICHDGILSDDAGQNCADGLYDRVYGASGSATTTSTSVSSTPAVSSGGGYGDVPGVPSSFAACVAYRESSNGAGSSNIYGITPGSGQSIGSGSIADQKAAFAHLYATAGPGAWSQWDGC